MSVGPLKNALSLPMHHQSSPQQTSSLKEYAVQICALSREQVFHSGMPLEAIKTCIADAFRILFDGTTPKFMDPSRYALASSGDYSDMYLTVGGMIYNLGQLCSPQLWLPSRKPHDASSAHCSLASHVDNLINFLETSREFTTQDALSVKATLITCLDCLIHRIAIDNQKEKHRGFFIETPLQIQNRIYFLNTENGWRMGSYDSTIEKPVYIVPCDFNNSQSFLLNHRSEPVDGSGVVITAEMYPEVQAALLDPEERAYRLGNMVYVKFFFYDGITGALGSGRNSVTLTANIDLHTKDRSLVGMREESMLEPPMKNALTTKEKKQYFDRALDLYEVFGGRMDHHLKHPVTVTLFEPKSQDDKVKVIWKMLSILEKNPGQNLRALSYIAEQMDPVFSDTEISAMTKNGEIKKDSEGNLEVTPDALVAKLKKDTSERLKALLPKHNSSAPLPPSPEIKEETGLTPEQRLAKEAEKARRRAEHAFLMQKEQRKAAATLAAPEEKKPPAFELNAREQGVVQSIYNGQSIKTEDFTTLAMQLLQKKSESLEATVSSKRKGSHVKFHLKRQNGPASGLTLVIPHKRRDHQGSLCAQKDTLDRIFSLQ